MDTVYKISKAEQLNTDTFLFTINSEKVSKKARAGQIVHVKCGDEDGVLLRRPISICSVDRENGTFDIVFQIRGKGTKILSKYKAGDDIDIMGPLGQGFSLYPKHKKIIVVGGGIGIFPLLQLLKDHPAENKKAILGFRDKSCVILEKEFKQASDKLIITTDDGSYGEKGFVTDILKKELDKEPADMVFFCGPLIMMKLGVGIVKEYDIPCQVSMEQRMGCGIGACLVCVCKTKKGDDWDYTQVCKKGPVFGGDDIIFD
ncbi:MAG: dihydroorotate dehydrogenase electron transfer subunit [Acetivibrionales bacterium]|jgi:dihydroorotate dehydrogenase electron transfer subunit|nr:dihydroorotate dehydrogenase electron transfer subunit [Clostridiaceae bacterium]